MLGRAKVFTAHLCQGWGGPDVGLHGVVSSTGKDRGAAQVQPLEQGKCRRGREREGTHFLQFED